MILPALSILPTPPIIDPSPTGQAENSPEGSGEYSKWLLRLPDNRCDELVLCADRYPPFGSLSSVVSCLPVDDESPDCRLEVWFQKAAVAASQSPSSQFRRTSVFPQTLTPTRQVRFPGPQVFSAVRASV